MSSSVRGSSNFFSNISAAFGVIFSLGPSRPRSRTSRRVARCTTGTVELLSAWCALRRVGTEVARVLMGAEGRQGGTLAISGTGMSEKRRHGVALESWLMPNC